MAAAPQPPSSPSFQARAHAAVQHAWRQRGPLAWALWPLSQLYGALGALRRWLYRSGLRRTQHAGVPTIVVGNVIAGGAGKTPVVMAVVRHLQAQGWRPGVISRGYGRSTHDCRAVLPDSPASEVGDEPALIARSCAVPVVVAARRMDAARALLAQHPDTDVLVCDDGLQHWPLARDIDICVFNDQGVGNGFLLPAGPLREPWPRPVDLVVYSTSAPATPDGAAASGTAPNATAPGLAPNAAPRPDHGAAPPHSSAPAFALQRQLANHAVRQDGTRVALHDLRQQPLLAVAAIARPDDFFAMLRARHLTLAATQALPDHFDFDSWKRPPDKGYTLICTEKDATKLWRHHPDALAVPLQVRIAAGFFAALDARLPRRLSSPP